MTMRTIQGWCHHTGGFEHPSDGELPCRLTDADDVRGAIEIIRRRRKRKTFVGDVLIAALNKIADDIEAGPSA